MEKLDAEIIADGIVKGFEKTANSIDRSSERSAQAIIQGSEINAQAIVQGFRETARIIGKSLGGTRAELMMDCLLLKSKDGTIPKPDSKEWDVCKTITTTVLEEFE